MPIIGLMMVPILVAITIFTYIEFKGSQSWKQSAKFNIFQNTLKNILMVSRVKAIMRNVFGTDIDL